MPDMLEMIKSLGSQLRWAAALEIPDLESNQDFVVAGMGGSGIGGDYLSAVTTQTPVSVYAQKSYAPFPGWVYRVRPLILGISYSGNTEETLSAVDDAEARGLSVVALTGGGALRESSADSGRPTIEIPSGLQPRAAIGYLFGAALRVVGESSGLADFVDELNEAAAIADEITTEGSSAWALAEQIAGALQGRATIVYGGGPISGAAAQRWKTQINENAKMPAWWSLLPELDHNEIVGWETLTGVTGRYFGIVGLTDGGDHERIADRFEFTRDLTENAVPWAGMVESTGRSEVARIISLTAVGDLVSWMLAVNADVDPVPVGTIEKLKKLLAGEG